MNKARKARLQEAIDILTEVKDEEQEALDNLPDSFRDGEQGEKMEEAISNIDEAVSQLEEIVNA